MKKRSKSGKSRTSSVSDPKPRFSEKRLTSRAGLIPLGRFLDKLVLIFTLS
jgi:hypothetical protein